MAANNQQTREHCQESTGSHTMLNNTDERSPLYLPVVDVGGCSECWDRLVLLLSK